MPAKDHRAGERREEPSDKARDALLAIEVEQVEECTNVDGREPAVQLVEGRHVAKRKAGGWEGAGGGGKGRDGKVHGVEDVALQKRDGKSVGSGAVEFVAEVPEVCDDVT